MQLRFEDRRHRSAEPCRIQFGTSLIPVRRPRSLSIFLAREARWTWIDGREFCLRWFIRENPYFRIEASDETLCAGHIVHWRWSAIEWRCAPTVYPIALRENQGFCRGSITDENGRRLAVWRNLARGCRVVIRPNLNEDLVGVLAAIFVTNDCGE
jgi:hypothetical protein